MIVCSLFDKLMKIGPKELVTKEIDFFESRGCFRRKLHEV